MSRKLIPNNTDQPNAAIIRTIAVIAANEGLISPEAIGRYFFSG